MEAFYTRKKKKLGACQSMHFQVYALSNLGRFPV